MDLDLTPTPTHTPTKSPDDTEIDTPPHHTVLTQPLINPLSFTKNHHHHHHRHHHHHHHHQPPPHAAVAVAVTYKECMKNHAATLGGHAVDGCGEFIMTNPNSNPSDPTSLKCAACGCHRNFHRQEPDFAISTAITPPFLDFRHPPRKRSSLSPSPPPHHHPCTMLLALGTSEDHHQAPMTPTAENPAGRKRFRTKFSREQKEKMHAFAEKLGWRMQKCDEAKVEEFCRDVGVAKGVLKVWMHNNKNTFVRKEIANGRMMMIRFENNDDDDDDDNGGKRDEEGKKIGNGSHFRDENGGGVPFHGSNNGSSSST